jgi:hypothetical protein
MKTNMIQNVNNKAIRMLQQGEFKACQLECKIAIEYMLAEADDEGSSQSAAMYDPEEMRTAQAGPVGVELEGPLFSKDPKSSPGNLFHLYNTAFALPTKESYRPTVATQSQDQDRLSAVLFYNMALSNHTQAFSPDNNTMESLNSALRLYQMSFTIIQGNAELVEEDSGFFLLLLGLVNNMGHIYSHFCMNDKAQECGAYLEMLTSLPSAEEIMYEDEMYFFMRQVVFCSFHHCIVASAA